MLCKEAIRTLLSFVALLVLVSTVRCSDSGGTDGSSMAAPEGVTAGDGAYSDVVAVKWSGGPEQVMYTIYRADSSDGDYASIGDMPGVLPHVFVDTAVTADVHYYYRIKAANENSESGFSATDEGWAASAAEKYLTKPPLEASDGTYNGYVQIDSAPFFNMTLPLPSTARLQLFRATAIDGAYTIVSDDLKTIPYEESSATEGVHYFYKVRYAYGSIVSEFSDLNEGWALPFRAPNTITATQGTGSLNIEWEDISGYNTHYDLYKASASGGPYTVLKSDCLSNYYSDFTATPGVHYFYKVKIVTQSGSELNKESEFSEYAEGWRS